MNSFSDLKYRQRSMLLTIEIDGSALQMTILAA